MKEMMKRFAASGFVFALVFAGLTAAVTSSAAGPGPGANGHGTLLRVDENGKTVKRQFSLSARTRSDGNVDGNAVLHNPAFEGANGKNYQLQIDIECMKVIGNVAIFGGTTRRTNDPNLVDAVYFSVEDNGEPGQNDRISGAYFFDDDPDTTGDPQGCQLIQPGDLLMETIESGNIQVRP